MPAQPTPSIISRIAGTAAPQMTPEEFRQMAHDELPKVNPERAATFGPPSLGAGASFSLRFSVDGDAIMDGSGLRDGDVKLSRLADGMSVAATFKF